MSWFEEFLTSIRNLFWNGTNSLPIIGIEPLETVSPRVLVVNFDPVLNAQGARLTEVMGWNNIDPMIDAFIKVIEEVSYGLVKYRYDPANRLDVDAFPIKQDGFQYSPAGYLDMMQHEITHHEPDGVDYMRIVRDFHLFDRITSGEIDEVWLFGGPYFGFWESHMVGQGAIWCNSAPLDHSDLCTRRFVIMGFNYQRGVTKMIHNIGHRMESVMGHVYGSFGTYMDAYRAVLPESQPPVRPGRFASPKNDFERFLLYDKIAPGQAGIGLIHTPPNAASDYDWQNMAVVSSSCDDWLIYPNQQGTRRLLNCAEWNCNEHDFIKWWFRHVPHASGSMNGILNNWWRYTMQVDRPFRPG